MALNKKLQFVMSWETWQLWNVFGIGYSWKC